MTAINSQCVGYYQLPKSSQCLLFPLCRLAIAKKFPSESAIRTASSIRKKRVWSTRVKISPVLKIFGKIRVFSRSKYWTLLAQGSAWQTTTHHFWHIVSAFKFRLQKCNSMTKQFKKREKTFVGYTAQSEICPSVRVLFCFNEVLLHSQVYNLIKVRKWNKEPAVYEKQWPHIIRVVPRVTSTENFGNFKGISVLNWIPLTLVEHTACTQNFAKKIARGMFIREGTFIRDRIVTHPSILLYTSYVT